MQRSRRHRAFRQSVGGHISAPLKITIAAAGLLATVLMTMVMLKNRPITADMASEPVAMTITTATVSRESWVEEVTASGSILPWQESVIGAQIDGLRLAGLSADVGDVVKKGQVLARFDDALLRAEVDRLRAALSQAMALAAQARLDAQRAVQLQPSGALSGQAALSAVTQADVTEAAAASARAELHAKEVELSYAVLRSPDDGIISERLATVGTVLKVGEALFRLIRQQRLEWHGEVSAKQLKDISKGQVVVLQLPDGTAAMATVRQAAPTLGADSRMGLVYADLQQGSNARAGMYASGKIGFGRSSALVVPSASVVVRDGRSYAFVVDHQGDTGRVGARPVGVRRRQGRSVEIVAGDLSEGVDVAVDGAGFLSDGDLVRIVPPAASRSVPVQAIDAIDGAGR